MFQSSGIIDTNVYYYDVSETRPSIRRLEFESNCPQCHVKEFNQQGIPMQLSRRMGCLDEIKCFEHCEEDGRISRILQQASPAHLKLSRKWKEDMSHCETV